MNYLHAKPNMRAHRWSLRRERVMEMHRKNKRQNDFCDLLEAMKSVFWNREEVLRRYLCLKLGIRDFEKRWGYLDEHESYLLRRTLAPVPKSPPKNFRLDRTFI